ncbi:MAG TPA: response regulator transcription factor [Phycisphaerae bacterium]|nr:response regulator transcription factor [Phycisphaerae bacterium]
MSKTTPTPAAPPAPAAAPAVGADANKRKIFIVDDHPIVRQGLVQLINPEPDLMVIGQGEDAYQALKQIRAQKPDLTLLDISLKDTGGIELLKEMRAQEPDLRVLILSMHDESLYAERALRAGARGYVMKQEAPQVLLQAIRKVLNGEVWVSEKMSAVLLQRMVGNRKPGGALPMDRLTDREMEIFRMIGAGMTVKEIAEKLFLSAKTIEAHREHIKEKLSLKTSAELLRFAIRNAPDEQ